MDLQSIYNISGRPGAAKLRDAARRRGLDVSLKEAQTSFEDSQQRRSSRLPPPKSDGKVTSPELNQRWQADLLDFKQQDPEKTKATGLRCW